MKTKGIIFDMDGLIFDTESVYYAAAQSTADAMGFQYDLDLYKKYLGVSDEKLWREYHQIFAEHGQNAVQEFIDRSWQRAFDAFEAGEVALKPGVETLLDYLDEKAIDRLVASSNQRPVIKLLLEQAGLQTRFSGIISADDVKNAKPAPDIFLKALAQLGTQKDATLVLEDSQNGILAAAAADLPVIMVPDMLPPTEELTSKALAVVPSLYEVKEYLK